MSKGFGDICTQPFICSKTSLPNTVSDHCLEKVFIKYKVNLWEFQSHLEAFDQW
jgi:hypothetical protein